MESTDSQQPRAGESEQGDNKLKPAHVTEVSNGGVGALLPPVRLDISPMPVNVVNVHACKGMGGAGREGGYGNTRGVGYATPQDLETPYLVKPELRLCHAIFSRAVMDLNKAQHVAREARKWLFGDPPYQPSRDYIYSFENVCLFLDYDHKKTLARIQRYLDSLARAEMDRQREELGYQVAGSTAGIPAEPEIPDWVRVAA